MLEYTVKAERLSMTQVYFSEMLLEKLEKNRHPNSTTCAI